MTTDTARRYPAPLYAAAGAGDLAYQQLRKLPARAVELTGKLRPVVTDAVREPKLRVDRDMADRVRDVAIRNAAVLLTGVQAAQERAAAVYTDLVARGEKVVEGPKPLPPAGDLVTIDEPAGLPAPEAGGPAAASVNAKPVKKTRPAAAKK
jgi:heparin binding hemagglutinin HbhA